MTAHAWLSATEAARRLGVKPSTLYAYVSRGQLRRRAAGDGRRSEYHAGDVASLAVRGRRSRPGRPSDIIVPTAVTRISERGPVYRGRVAVDDAGVVPFDAVADHLWAVDHLEAWSVARTATASASIAGLAPCDRLIPVVAAARVADALRDDLRPPVVVACARKLIAGVADAVVGVDVPAGATAPERLAHGLGTGSDAARLFDAAMVLLADHELAASTLAVRVAASARCDPYAAVLAGLTVVSGARHGGASRPLELALADVAAGVPADVALDRHRRDRVAPGFGHPLYPHGDPRAVRLLELLQGSSAALAEPVSTVIEVARSRGFPPPNIDVALAAVTHSVGAPVGTGELLFSIARMVGWVAHALEQYDEPDLLRPTAVYVGR